MEAEHQEKTSFEVFLEKKNIDAQAFQQGYPARFSEWEAIFAQMHEESFLMQKKFYINPIRRKFPKIRYQNS